MAVTLRVLVPNPPDQGVGGNLSRLPYPMTSLKATRKPRHTARAEGNHSISRAAFFKDGPSVVGKGVLRFMGTRGFYHALFLSATSELVVQLPSNGSASQDATVGILAHHDFLLHLYRFRCGAPKCESSAATHLKIPDANHNPPQSSIRACLRTSPDREANCTR